MAFHQTQEAERLGGIETGHEKEDGVGTKELWEAREADMRLGLCDYDQIMKEFSTYREGVSHSNNEYEPREGEDTQVSDMEYGVSERKNETLINPESAKIYEQANVELEKCNKEILAGQEYEVYKQKGVDLTLECPDGKTNKERMEQGLAPYIEKDDKLIKVELHHHGQNGNGPLVEIGSDAHKEQDAVLHPGTGKGEGRGFDPLWDQKRSEHWQMRAEEI